MVDANGEILLAADVGPGVGQVAATHAGDVWIGYTDTGVFEGNSLSRHGLVKFDDSLRPVWKFADAKSRHGIDDCEGINAYGDTLWLCPYFDVPALRVRDDEVDSWDNSECRTNIGAVLVDEATGTVGLVATGWSRHPGRCAVGHLTDTTFMPDRALKLRLPHGAALPGDAELTAKGSQLHIVHGLDWYRVDLRELS